MLCTYASSVVCAFRGLIISSRCLMLPLTQTFDAVYHVYATLLDTASSTMNTQVSATLISGTKNLLAIFFFSVTPIVAHTCLIVLLHGSTRLSHDNTRTDH